MTEVLIGSRVDVYMAAELLTNNGIAAMIKPRMGAGFVIRAGDMMESYTLLVRESDADAAHELIRIFLTDRGQMEPAAPEKEEANPVEEIETLEMLEDLEEDEDA